MESSKRLNGLQGRVSMDESHRQHIYDEKIYSLWRSKLAAAEGHNNKSRPVIPAKVGGSAHGERGFEIKRRARSRLLLGVL